MTGSTTIARSLASATLEGFAQFTAEADGVDVRGLAPLTSLLVRTKNSVYQITVTERTAVIVQGGQFFPDPTPAEVSGATMGGSFLKLGWIGVGLCMEIRAGDQPVITTRVRSITVNQTHRESRLH